MNRNAAFGVGALFGAAAALVWDRRSRLRPASVPASRQRALREKLAGAQQVEAPAPPAAAPPRPAAAPPPTPAPAEPPPPPAAAGPPHAPEPPAPAPPPPGRPAPAGPSPTDEFEAMRRRIHEEGKAAAEEMRRAPEEPS